MLAGGANIGFQFVCGQKYHLLFYLESRIVEPRAGGFTANLKLKSSSQDVSNLFSHSDSLSATN